MPINRDPSTPPPVIGKIGPYTVFMTPPATPKPPESPSSVPQNPIVQPPVLPPPQQFKSVASSEQDGSVLGFFKNAVTKVQNGTEREKSEDEDCSVFVLNYFTTAHSSVDDHLVRWFGLNQSKYQWALDEYYEGKGSSEMKSVEAKEMPGKVQSV
ncbi:hypothetical protein IGI04_033991 [Brassica rapa subsp. trilocularis]|uniref:Hydroxyproline-rich glycoprotein family protein n=1 Tax=Brassica rapa subsp. trilocularis TaxID=1813537 RepID=A0ABQ7LB97_BRACM|nr:hypothetical protein IGI04_033986 [Brassica rapa subsp. trilocularis]KAG5382521.1 hypothetical protein IGI04_033991 [Brassica rapa subsp. trilocularis]